MRYPIITFVLAAGLASIPSPRSGRASAQAVPVRTLTTADAEFSEPFSQITGIRELKNGRVVVADNREKTIQLVDFKSGAATKIGREGSGPGEYGLPMSVFAAPGDTTWVFDVLNSRYLVIDPNGKAVSTFMMSTPDAPTPAPQGRGGALRLGGGFRLGFAQGIDAQGRLYFRAPTVRFGNEAPATIDTTPILRWDRRTDKTDTVGLLTSPAGPPPAIQRGGGGGDEVRVSVRVGGGATPFASGDAYAVTAAGDVAVVRARDYHVDWIVKGRTVSGQPIAFDRVRVTDADKKNWAAARQNAGGVMISNDNGNRSVRTGPPPEEGPTTFPEFKGPFQSQVVAAPNGHIWVPKYMPADSPPTYDVIDNTGKVVQRVVLPKRTRLLGFGTGTLYLARSDEDDLQYLQRYRW